MAVTDGSIISGSDVKSLLGETTDTYDTLITLSIRRAEGAVKRFLKYDPVQRSRTEFYPQSEARSAEGRRSRIEASATQAIFTSEESVRGNELQLQHIPVRATVAIDLRVDYNARAGTTSGSFAVDTQQTEGSGFWANYDGIDSSGYKICRDGIIRSYGLWPLEPGSIKVVYTAGYTANEFQGQDSVVDAVPIWSACLGEAVQRSKKGILNLKSTTLGHIAGPKIEEDLGDYRYKVSDKLSQQVFGANAYDLLPESVAGLDEFVNYGYALFS